MRNLTVGSRIRCNLGLISIEKIYGFKSRVQMLVDNLGAGAVGVRRGISRLQSDDQETRPTRWSYDW